MIKYIKDVDTGEIYPVRSDSEKEALNNVPGFVEDDFPEIHVNYSGENGVNDIIADLTTQLKEEKASRTVIHKFPIAKILSAAALVAVLVVGCVFGVRFASSIQFEPVTVKYSESVTTETEEPIETAAEEVPTEQADLLTEVGVLSEKLGNVAIRCVILLITLGGVRLAIKFMMNTIHGS